MPEKSSTRREDRDRCRTNVLTGHKGPTLYPRAHLQLGWARSMLSDNRMCMCMHCACIGIDQQWHNVQVSCDTSNVHTNFTMLCRGCRKTDINQPFVLCLEILLPCIKCSKHAFYILTRDFVGLMSKKYLIACMSN